MITRLMRANVRKILWLHKSTTYKGTYNWYSTSLLNMPSWNEQ